MPRTAAKITQADIARAVRGLRAAGVDKVRVVFRDGGVSVEEDDGGSVDQSRKLAHRGREIIL